MEILDNLKGLSKLFIRIAIFSLIVLLCFEGALRFVGNVDRSGQFVLGGITIPPFRINYNALQRNVNGVTSGDSLYTYSEDTGFTISPNKNLGRMLVNSQGVRTGDIDFVYDLEPADDVLRIALFGDSNVHGGGGIRYEETWGYVLEQTLTERGIPAEVINFGIPSYSPTQSELRWEYEGRDFQPDIVMFGASNRLITVSANMYRGFILDTAPAFITPMYYSDGDDLLLINYPAVPPTETEEILRNWRNHPFSEYEQHNQPDALWMQSRFLATISLSFDTSNQADYNMNSIDVLTFIAIMDKFAETAEESDAVFMFSHLAVPNSIRMNVGQGQLPFQPILDDIASRHHVIDTMDLFPYVNEAHWQDSHYTAIASDIVGTRMADYIEACLQDDTCTPPRFRGN